MDTGEAGRWEVVPHEHSGLVASVQAWRKRDPREHQRRRTVLSRGLVVRCAHLWSFFVLDKMIVKEFIVCSTNQSRTFPKCAAVPPFLQMHSVGSSTIGHEYSLETTIHRRSSMASTLLSLPSSDRRRSLFRSRGPEGIRRKNSTTWSLPEMAIIEGIKHKKIHSSSEWIGEDHLMALWVWIRNEKNSPFLQIRRSATVSTRFGTGQSRPLLFSGSNRALEEKCRGTIGYCACLQYRCLSWDCRLSLQSLLRLVSDERTLERRYRETWSRRVASCSRQDRMFEWFVNQLWWAFLAEKIWAISKTMRNLSLNGAKINRVTNASPYTA